MRHNGILGRQHRHAWYWVPFIDIQFSFPESFCSIYEALLCYKCLGNLRIGAGLPTSQQTTGSYHFVCECAFYQACRAPSFSSTTFFIVVGCSRSRCSVGWLVISCGGGEWRGLMFWPWFSWGQGWVIASPPCRIYVVCQSLIRYQNHIWFVKDNSARKT